MLFFVALNTYSLIVISLHYGMLFVIVCHAIFIDFLWFFNVFDTFSLVFHAFSIRAMRSIFVKTDME